MRTTNDVIFAGRVDTAAANSISTDGKAIPSPRALGLKMQTSSGLNHGVSSVSSPTTYFTPPQSPRRPRSPCMSKPTFHNAAAPAPVAHSAIPFSHPTATTATATDATTSIKTRTLTPAQLRALLDILTHYETFDEARSFRNPDTISKYGYPLIKGDGQDVKSGMPLLQLLLTKIILPTPGFRDLAPTFWNETISGLMKKMAEADLSEAYDKGAVGTRKILATVTCSLHEGVTRGLLGGVPGPTHAHGGSTKTRPYKRDPKTASGLAAGWDWVAREAVYGSLIDDLFDHLAKTPDMDSYSPGVAAAVDYAIIHIATFLHYIFVLSPEGQYLLKLFESVHKMIPYSMMAQTLRIGNAATMINGIVKLFLAKMSVGGLTNWMGITKNADDGMNLMQKIISMVLGYDASDFRKIAENIKKCKDKSNMERLTALDEHMKSSQQHKDEIRERSKQQQESIVMTILTSKNVKLVSNLTDEQHTQCLEYYSAMLSVRDREKLIDVMCCSKPDLVTSAVRDGLASFEPMIRNIHSHVNLRKYVGFMQTLLEEFIQTSKPKKMGKGKNAKAVPPSVEDYVELLRRNRLWFYEYMHEFAVGCPELTGQFREWVKKTFTGNYQRETPVQQNSADSQGEKPFWSGAGALDRDLQAIFCKLPLATQESVLSTLDMHDRYLRTLEKVSDTHLQGIIDRLSGKSSSGDQGSMNGPGIYLARWQSLLDRTPITPSTRSGPPRSGKDVKHLHGLGKTGATKDMWDAGELARQQERMIPAAPDGQHVAEALGPQFRDLVANISCNGLKKAKALS